MIAFAQADVAVFVADAAAAFSEQSDELLSLAEECEEITHCLAENGIRRCYYGHMHGKAAIAAFNGEKYGIHFKLISADTLGFCPYLIEK